MKKILNIDVQLKINLSCKRQLSNKYFFGMQFNLQIRNIQYVQEKY